MTRVAALVSPNFMPKISATRSKRAKPTRPQLRAPITASAPAIRRTVDVTTFFSLSLLSVFDFRLRVGTVDVATPRARLGAALLDHFLEALEISGRPAMHESEHVAD